MTFHDIEQNTPEWFQMRAGLLTSSNLPKVMANFGSPFGNPAKVYAIKVAVEQITGNPILSNYSNEHMQRGQMQEPMARKEYEDEMLYTVTNGGFFGDDFVGCSPDGLVDDNGVIEIKSVIAHVHYSNVEREKVDPAYKWQCIGNLKFTGRDWLDFVSYCEDYPEGKRIYRCRIHKRDYFDEFRMIDERVGEFKRMVERYKKHILEGTYSVGDE